MLEVFRKLLYLSLLNILNYWRKHARSIQESIVSPTAKHVKLTPWHIFHKEYDESEGEPNALLSIVHEHAGIVVHVIILI